MPGLTDAEGRHTDLILIRHGQTRCTTQGRFCGDHEGELSAAGVQMAEYVANHPALTGADLLLSSPSRRSVATAETIAGQLGTPVSVEHRLRELAFGDWEDRLPDEVADTDEHRRWTADPALFSPPGGESGLTVMARAVAAVRDGLMASSKVVAVSHKAPIRLIVAFFLGLPPSRYRDIGNVCVGSLSWLRLEKTGVAVLRALGDVSHLPPSWRAAPDLVDGATTKPVTGQRQAEPGSA